MCPDDRRYQYPFINCTNCGPRYSIVTDVPYDRSATTMSSFPMYNECEREYHDPKNRHFHAQPNACPECGHKIWLEMSRQKPEGTGLKSESGGFFGLETRDLKSDVYPERQPKPQNDEALRRTITLLRNGTIVAIKELGGFHLACDATNQNAVMRLRDGKRNRTSPLHSCLLTLRRYRVFALFHRKKGCHLKEESVLL